MHIRSELLGDLEATEEQLVDFPTGIFGFPECRRFALLPGSREGTYWLQSAEHATLVFLLVDPFIFVPGYVVDLPPGELQELQVTPGTDLAVLSIVTLPRQRDDAATANLQGPLALNLAARLGKQIVIPESTWGVREPIELRS